MADTDQHEYTLLFRGNWDTGLSPEKTQEILDQCRAWYGNLLESGKIVGGQALTNEVVTLSGSTVTTDGPFAESKEVVGGYCIVRAGSFEEATEIARLNPCLEYGTSIEVRAHTSMCPVQERLDKLAAATV